MISYNNEAPKAVNNVGQFGATEGSIGAYKSAAEYASDAKYWALLSQTKYSSTEEVLAEVERLYAQGRLLEEDIKQLKNDFESQEQTLLGLIQSTGTAIDNTNAATELSKEATQNVLAQLDIISNMSVQTTLLPPGSLATGSYDNTTGVFSFGIPEGKPGRDGTDGTISDIGSVPVGTPVSNDYGFYVDKDDGGLYRANMSDIANLVPSIRSISINGGEEQTGAVSFNSVSSFNTRTGDVVPQSGDYTAAQVGAFSVFNNLSEITNTSEAIKNIGLADYGIATEGLVKLSSFDWQTFVFTNSARYYVDYSDMTNLPEGLIYSSNVGLFIEVIGVFGSVLEVRVVPSTVSKVKYITYAVRGSGNIGSRIFVVREELSSGVPVTISQGGTGATTASAARANLGLGLVATESIVPITKGGTGSTSAENARLALVSAKSGNNYDITSLNNLTTPLSLGQGGTGATTASAARANLGALSTSEADSLIKDAVSRIVIFASDFGVSTTASTQENEQALYNLGVYISQSDKPLYVKFPAGTVVFGSQQQSGASGAGYSFRPSYLARSWSDASAVGWFSVNNTNQEHIIDLRGCELKLSNGLKVGSFGPITGLPYDQGSLETPLFDYNANTGVIFKIRKAPNIKVLGGIINGNLGGAVWGGKFGNTGYQTLCYNMWVNESLGVEFIDHISINSPVDGVYFQHPTEFTKLNIVKASKFTRCRFSDCGRNCFSLTGGRSVIFDSCIFNNSGRRANAISNNYSGPESCMDIEAESGFPSDVSFKSCKLFNAGEQAVYTVSIPNRVSDIFFEDCFINGFNKGGAVNNVGPTNNVVFRNCDIVGSVIDSGSSMVSDSYSFYGCSISNNYAGVNATSFKVNFKCKAFKNNKIVFGIPSSGDLVSEATINISDKDLIPGGLRNYAFEGNELEVYGDASRITFPNSLGGVNFFRGAELYVNSSGVSGGSLSLNTTTTNQKVGGFYTNSTNFSFSGSMIKADDANLWFSGSESYVQSTLLPAAGNTLNIGSKEKMFSSAFIEKGLILQDLTNTSNYYRMRIVDGAIDLVLDS